MEIKAKGIAEAIARVQGVRRRTIDLTPVLPVIAEDLQKVVSDAFRRESDPSTGKPWASLEASTVKRKAKAKKTKMLVMKGTLRNSVATRTAPRDGVVWVGTNVPYGKYIQLGTSKMKRRRFLPVKSYALDSPMGKAMMRIRKRVGDYILTGRVNG